MGTHRELFPMLTVSMSPEELTDWGLVSSVTFARKYGLTDTTLSAAASANYLPAVRTTYKCRHKWYMWPRDARHYLTTHAFRGDKAIPLEWFHDPYRPRGRVSLGWNPDLWEPGDPMPWVETPKMLDDSWSDQEKAVHLLDQGYGMKAAAKLLDLNPTELRKKLIEAGEWPRGGKGYKAIRKKAEAVETPEPAVEPEEPVVEEPAVEEPEVETEEPTDAGPETEVFVFIDEHLEDEPSEEQPGADFEGFVTFYYKDTPFRAKPREKYPFVVKDVCRHIGIKNPSMAAARLDPDDLSSTETIDSMGRVQTMLTANLEGVFDLVTNARTPESRPFRKWVTHTVLPALAAQGSYTMGEEHVVDASPRLAAIEGVTAQLVQISANQTAAIAQQEKNFQELQALFAQQARLNTQQAETNNSLATAILENQKGIQELRGAVSYTLGGISNFVESVDERLSQTEGQLLELADRVESGPTVQPDMDDMGITDKSLIVKVAEARGMDLFRGNVTVRTIERRLKTCTNDVEFTKLQKRKAELRAASMKETWTDYYDFLRHHAGIGVHSRMRNAIRKTLNQEGFAAARAYENRVRPFDFIKPEEMERALARMVQKCVRDGLDLHIFETEPRLKEMLSLMKKKGVV